MVNPPLAIGLCEKKFEKIGWFIPVAVRFEKASRIKEKVQQGFYAVDEQKMNEYLMKILEWRVYRNYVKKSARKGSCYEAYFMVTKKRSTLMVLCSKKK